MYAYGQPLLSRDRAAVFVAEFAALFGLVGHDFQQLNRYRELIGIQLAQQLVSPCFQPIGDRRAFPSFEFWHTANTIQPLKYVAVPLLSQGGTVVPLGAGGAPGLDLQPDLKTVTSTRISSTLNREAVLFRKEPRPHGSAIHP